VPPYTFVVVVCNRLGVAVTDLCCCACRKTTHYHPSDKKGDKYDKDDKYDDSYITGDKTTKKPAGAKPEDSPYWKSYEPKDDPFDAYGNAGPGTGKDAYNTAPEHVWEHLGPCISSNHVGVMQGE
jgi:hypothetical protein